MKYFSKNTFIFFWITFLSSSYSYAANNETSKVCGLFKQEKQHVAYLLNKNGKISEGPIDYGKWIDDGISEDVLIPTHFKILIYPASTEINNNDCSLYGCLKLTKNKPVCKGVATYDVEVRLVFRRKGCLMVAIG